MKTVFSLRAAALAIATTALSVPAFGFGIGLQPTTVEMEVEPGDRQRQVVSLGNVHQEKTISLTLGLADWSLDEAGQIVLAPPGEGASSAADWVRFSPAFVTLKPGETEQVVVDMAAPIRVDRQGDHRFALIASTILPESRSGQSGVWKKYQIASLFYLTLGEAESQPVITSANLGLLPDGQQAVEISVENNGNAHARLRGEVRVSGDRGETLKLPVGNLVVLDDAKRVYALPLTGELPANPRVDIELENIFAPQYADRIQTLQPFVSELTVKKADLPANVTETTLE